MSAEGTWEFQSTDKASRCAKQQQYLPNGAEYTYALERLLIKVNGELHPGIAQTAVLNTIRILREEDDMAKLLLYTENNVLDVHDT